MAHSVEILLPAQRYVFALENGDAEPQPATTSAEGFKSYKRLQAEGKVAGMIAMPNCLPDPRRRELRRRPGLDDAGRAGDRRRCARAASSRTRPR